MSTASVPVGDFISDVFLRHTRGFVKSHSCTKCPKLPSLYAKATWHSLIFPIRFYCILTSKPAVVALLVLLCFYMPFIYWPHRDDICRLCLIGSEISKMHMTRMGCVLLTLLSQSLMKGKVSHLVPQANIWPYFTPYNLAQNHLML